MANKKIIVKNSVDIITYSAAVDEIVNKFFDDEGNYTPHFGRANAVGVFFNYFVDIASFDAYFTDVNDETDLDFILGNDKCIDIYNEALSSDKTYKLNFANAYKDALEIVKQKNASFTNVINNIKNAASYIADKIAPTFAGENLERLTEIAKDVSNGNLSADSIVAAYGNSQRIKDITK